MSESLTAPPSLIQELDARQDDVLEQLNQLNSRVEALLKQYLENRSQERDAGSDEGE